MTGGEPLQDARPGLHCPALGTGSHHPFWLGATWTAADKPRAWAQTGLPGGGGGQGGSEAGGGGRQATPNAGLGRGEWAELETRDGGLQGGEVGRGGCGRSTQPPRPPWTPVCFCRPQSPPLRLGFHQATPEALLRQLPKGNWAETSREAVLLPAEQPSPVTRGAGPQLLYFGWDTLSFTLIPESQVGSG